MKQDFPLQPLLEMRERDRDDAAAAVAGAQAEVTRLESTIRTLEAQRADLRTRQSAARSELHADIGRLQRLDEYLRAMDVEIAEIAEQIDAHTDTLRQRREVLRAAQGVLADAQVAAQAVEQKRDAWRAELRARAARAEEEAADEVGLRQWKQNNA